MDISLVVIVILAILLFIKVISKVVRLLIGIALLGAIIYFVQPYVTAMILL